jgi:hypothetical protein
VPQSATSVFTEPEDFAAALPHKGSSRFVITGRGRFRARLTRVALDSLCLFAGEEHLSRIAFITVPNSKILIALGGGAHPAPIWGGFALQTGEILTLGAGSRVHVRTDGRCQWSVILISEGDLARYGGEFVGSTFAVPVGIRLWHPPRTAGRQLRHLHAAAIRAVEFRQGELIGRDAAHGLEQQITVALIECLSVSSLTAETPAVHQCHEIMTRFETLRENQNGDNLHVAGISAALGVSQRALGRCCQTHLGMAPAKYLRLEDLPDTRTGSHDAQRN